MLNRIRLTPERIRAFDCPGGKKQAFLWDSDIRRLAIRATAGGSKSFVFQSSINDRTIRITIGDTRAWTVKDARAEATRLQRLIDQGDDPRDVAREKAARRAARKAEAEAAKAQAENRRKYTLKALCAAYVVHLESRGKTPTAAKSGFKCHVEGSDLADKPAREVTALEAAALIRAVAEAGKPRAASSLRSYLHAAYECAVRAPLDAALPSSLIPFGVEVNPIRAIPAMPGKARTRTLSVEELKAYVEALGDDITDQALRLALLAGGQRMRQVLRATLADWDGTVLRLFDPKGKRAEPREHLLPLAPNAASLADELMERAKAMKSEHLLSTFGKVPVSEFTISKRVREISNAIGGDPFDVRDIRRTVETMLAGMKVSRDVRAQLLSHGLSGVQQQHYDRWDYRDEKADALKKWEHRLQEIVSGKKPGKVVALR